MAVVDGMLDGLLALAARHGVAVIGGNISRSPGPLVVDVTAVGSVRPRRVLRRLEIPYGHFERRIQLPDSGLEAGTRELLNGCLILRLRKAGQAEGK